MAPPPPDHLPLAAADGGGARFGLYVHVPFCARRCGYCAFNTYAVEGTDPAARYRRYLEGVRAELELASVALADAPAVTSIYLGGGTPTLLGGPALASILAAVRSRLRLAPDVEVSVEANPEAVDQRLLDQLAGCGVDRMSFGLQSADPSVLELLDRRHRPERALAAVAEARRAGIRSVSLDLIAGTPGESDSSWQATVEAALSAQPDHLSVYSLTIEAGTKLAARVRSGALPAPDDDQQADRYLWTDQRLERAGYRWYEISNWATAAEHRCRHNLGYWRNDDWWGVGPGAHSHRGRRRWWNQRDPERWAAQVLAGRLPVDGDEEVTSEGDRLERLLLGLRLAEGIDPGGLDPDAVDLVARDGLAGLEGDRLVLTARGRLLADRVALALG